MRSGIQSKIDKHIKKQENISHYQEKNQSLEMYPEMTKLTELSDKNIRTPSINIFHMYKSMEKNMKIMKKQMENIIKTQMELLKIKKIPKSRNKKCTGSD